MELRDEDLKALSEISENIFSFVEFMWGLVPQPIKPEHEAFVGICINSGDFDRIKKEHFFPFIKGEHITWQQYLILSAYQKALDKTGHPEISVSSGHGIGKSASIAWMLLNFLFRFRNSNIACTAPSKEQMFDVLWKEVTLWLSRMKSQFIANFFKVTSDRIYVPGDNDDDRTWFARAKTAKKDNPEALAGIHSDNVLFLVDEASGVHDKIFEAGLGALTNENYVFIMISNFTRGSGYFWQSQAHHQIKHTYQRMSFSSEDSPVVDSGYCSKMLMRSKGDRDNDLYRVRVLGLPPKEGDLEDSEYFPLIKASTLNLKSKQISSVNINLGLQKWDPEQTIMGIDPSKAGKNRSVWLLRDNFRAEVVAKEETSSDLSAARKTWAILDYYNLIGCRIVIDNFGAGANLSQKIIEISGMPKFSNFLHPINVGDDLSNPVLKTKYLNLRAYYYDLMAQWLQKGGELVKDEEMLDKMSSLLYKFVGKKEDTMAMINKKAMIKMGFESPDEWDALMLTFKFFDHKLLYSSSVDKKINNIPNMAKPRNREYSVLSGDDPNYYDDYL